MQDSLAAATAAPGALRAVPAEFVIFGLTLVGIAAFHRRTVLVALLGLAATIAWKWNFGAFADGAGLTGLIAHGRHEAVLLSNLALLLLGFAL